ncbi:hypothetical protein PM082_024865 [Marasmius tenuissimus]|nr:hypothetical protein PM082_024865 [Marasmius tenuissimus]
MAQSRGKGYMEYISRKGAARLKNWESRQHHSKFSILRPKPLPNHFEPLEPLLKHLQIHLNSPLNLPLPSPKSGRNIFEDADLAILVPPPIFLYIDKPQNVASISQRAVIRCWTCSTTPLACRPALVYPGVNFILRGNMSFYEGPLDKPSLNADLSSSSMSRSGYKTGVLVRCTGFLLSIQSMC